VSVLAAVETATLGLVADFGQCKIPSQFLQLKAMPRSKASVDGDDHMQEFQLLKQDVQENQTEIAAMRAELNSLSAKQAKCI
jgi:hypothetical protein